VALTAYIDQTNRLLQYPVPTVPLYSTADLTAWINIARGQLAAEGECIRKIGTIAATAGQQSYNFSSIDLGTSSVTGIAGPLYVRRINYSVGNGQILMDNSSWEWFDQFYLNQVVPQSGNPEIWSQYGQGTTGSLYVYPVPDQAYTLNCDCNCYPIPLVDNSTVEAIPYLWTDAVPYFAAYLALLSAQSGVRQGQGDQMLARYRDFVARARGGATPPINRYLYEQGPDAAQSAKFAQKAGQ
jgi:hypothetical protein